MGPTRKLKNASRIFSNTGVRNTLYQDQTWGKIDFFEKNVNTFIWYFLMSVYESKSINEHSRKHLSSATNVSTDLGASEMHFQV